MALAAGTRLGRYEIRSVLGVGGMGEVYLAQDTQLRRPVALKLLPSQFTQDRERLRRFEQEARAAASFNHPNIAHIYEIGAANGTNFIAMEYVEGETLHAKIHRKKSDLKKLIEYLVQVAGGLAKAHAAGIVHRDLKPENIMVTREGFAKVLDFGLAKLVEPQESPGAGSREMAEAETAKWSPQSTPGVVMGTVGYMSPEQALGRSDEIDQRSDIFSFGCVLFEAATGRRPFEGDSVVDTLHKIIHAPTPLLRDFNSSAPADLQRIVRRCLAKDPEERYQTIKDVALELKELVGEMSGAAEIERSVPPQPSGGNDHAGGGQAMTERMGEPSARTHGLEPARSTSSVEYIVSEIKRHKTGAAVASVALVIALAAAAFGVLRLANQNKPAAAVPFHQMKMTKLTTDGKARDAAISPDGKYVVYVVDDAGQQSLRLKHVATASDVQIAPPDRISYRGLTFSPDSNYINYVTRRTEVELGVLYQVPVFGGAPRKLLEDVDSAITFSPDGKRFAFVRFEKQVGWALMAVNADGTEERTLARHDETPIGFSAAPAWSPDGRTVACGVMESCSDINERCMSVITVDTESGKEKPISSQKWEFIYKIAWLEDGSGLLMVARGKEQQSKFQIWHLSYPFGEARRITNDLNRYAGVSVTADSSALVTVQDISITNIWVAPDGEISRAEQITSGVESAGYYGVRWTPDSKIVYGSITSGTPNIWAMNADGTNQKQLTFNSGRNYYFTVSPDGHHIIFGSIRGDKQNIWRMNVDGSNPKQLTTGGDDTFPDCSPDNQWVVYSSLSQQNPKYMLWKAHIDGSSPVQLTDKDSFSPTVSPDGKVIAFFYQDTPNAPPKIAIIPFDGGEPIKTFDLPRSVDAFTSESTGVLRWMPDGRAVAYVDKRKGNIWSQPLEGGPPKQLTDSKGEQIYNFAWSRDGKQLALSRGTRTRDVVLISNFR